MLNITNLFGKSPIAPLQIHLKKVAACVNKLPDLINALKMQDSSGLVKIAEEISRLEHEADIAKIDIRNNISGKLFLSLPKASFLELVNTQDALADAVENISALVTLKNLTLPSNFIKPLDAFLEKNLEAFRVAQTIMLELPNLIESSFGGIEAEKIRLLVREVSLKEHEADVLQHDLLKALFNHDENLTPSTFYLWQKIFQELGMLSNLSEKLAEFILTTLES